MENRETANGKRETENVKRKMCNIDFYIGY